MSDYLDHITEVEDMATSINDLSLKMYNHGKTDALAPIKVGLEDFQTLERKMCRYFNMVDISSEKTELEKLALDIVCIGIQTMGALIGQLEEGE